MITPLIDHHDGESGQLIFSAPEAVFRDQPRSGPADDHVAWCLKHGGIRWHAGREAWIASLARTGGWTHEELAKADDQTLQGRIVWLAAGEWQDNERERAEESILPAPWFLQHTGGNCTALHRGVEFHVEHRRDDDAQPPWERSDGHGVVTGWVEPCPGPGPAPAPRPARPPDRSRDLLGVRYGS